MQLSNRISKVGESATLAVATKALQLAKSGVKIFRFDVGESDFPVPANVKKSAKKAIDEDFSKYTPVAGIPELREAICKKFKRDNGLNYQPDEVMASSGGKQVIYNALQVLLNEGDEAIIAKPYWVSFLEQVKLAGGTPKIVATDEKFKLSADAIAEAITEQTKVIILNSPCNPTGAIVDEKEQRKIADLAVEKGIVIISDEIYEHFVYDGKKVRSIAGYGEEIKNLTLTVNAISKTYGATGWRLGYVAGPKQIIKAMINLQSHSTTHPDSIVQKASIAALTGPQTSVKKMVKEFDKRRKLIVKRLQEIDGFETFLPEGAFYVFPKVSSFYKGSLHNSIDFANFLLDEAKCSVVPGLASDADNYVRFSYAASRKTIEQGMDTIEKAVKKLH